MRPPRSMPRCARLVLMGASLLFSCYLDRPVRSEVVRTIVRERVSFAGGHAFGKAGAYEKIVGRFELEVDPAAAINAKIADLKLAPRNSRGRVAFKTDFFLLKPIDMRRSNRRILYEVNNRGNKLMLGGFDDRGGNNPSTPADSGNGFLFRQGYVLLWSGWNGDVAPGENKLLIDLPVATENGKSITGPIDAEICVDARSFSQPFYWGGSNPYPTISLDNSTARLTKRLTRNDPPTEIRRDRWSFARFEKGRAVLDPKHLYFADGFEPGWLYDLVYVGKDPRITGLGLAAVRDVLSFLRYEKADAVETANPLRAVGDPQIERVYGFGISQSARFLNHFLYEGFNTDEKNRMVMDGVFAHVGGGGRGYFNARFAQTTRHGSPHEDNCYPSDLFPFTSTPTTDPLTGETGDMLETARRAGHIPKIFFTNTSTEYWCRAASLLHTTPEGSADVPLDPHVRLYFIAGGQHGVSATPERGNYQNPRNILDYRAVLRALLVAMDQWVGAGIEPPPSRYPHLADGTLVTNARFDEIFPHLSGVNLPKGPYAPLRLNFGPRWKNDRIADLVPPEIGPSFTTLVPAVGPDGNEIAGIRLPDLAAPIAAFTGWNLRGQRMGAEGELSRLTGSYFAFPRTSADRMRIRDPRAAVLERYPTRDDYVANVRSAATALQNARLLLPEDVHVIVERASHRRFWDAPSDK